MNKRNILLFSIIMSMSLLFVGCVNKATQLNNDNVNIDESSNKDSIKITELNSQTPKNTVHYEWSQLSEEDIVKDSNLIFKGTILDQKEYVIEQVVNDEYTQKIFKTIYSVKISEIYYSDDADIRVNDTISLMSPVTSHSWESDAIELLDGNEYILFANLVIDTEEIKFTDLSKYYIGNPWKPIISVQKDTFEVDEVFESLIQNNPLNKSDSNSMYIIDNENFMNNFQNMIKKYKKSL